MLIAMCRFKLNGKYVLPNEKFDVDDAELANDLIKRGRAKDDATVPKGAKAVEAKSGPTVKNTGGKAATGSGKSET